MAKNKNLFQDMVRVKQDANTKSNSKNTLSKLPVIAEKEINYKIPKRKPSKIDVSVEIPIERQKGSGNKYAFWIVAVIAIVGLFFSVSFFFSKAIVKVEPEAKAIALNESFSAVKNSTTIENLSFDTVSLSDEESIPVSGGTEKNVEEKAYGKVIIYNSYSSAPQNLNVDTRLIATNGKIYKTDKKVLVPGLKKDGTPGSVEVGIWAEKAGVDYNSGPLDLQILGFKGTSKYEKFFVKSKGEITGGFVGTRIELGELEKLAVFGELKNKLKKKLLEKAESQIPADVILYKDAISFTINEENIGPIVSGGEAKAFMKATFYGILIKESELAKKIAQKQIDQYTDAPIFIPQIRDLKFEFKNSDIPLNEIKDLDFGLTGNIVVVFKVDEEKLKNELLGKQKNILSEILPNFPSIKSAELSLKPFWLQKFPSNLKAISIEINYPH